MPVQVPGLLRRCDHGDHEHHARPARIDHAYVVKRDGLILCEATSTLACVDRSGRPTPIPEDVLPLPPKRNITPHDRINP